jgi:hypothetical protein
MLPRKAACRAPLVTVRAFNPQPRTEEARWAPGNLHLLGVTFHPFCIHLRQQRYLRWYPPLRPAVGHLLVLSQTLYSDRPYFLSRPGLYRVVPDDPIYSLHLAQRTRVVQQVGYIVRLPGVQNPQPPTARRGNHNLRHQANQPVGGFRPFRDRCSCRIVCVQIGVGKNGERSHSNGVVILQRNPEVHAVSDPSPFDGIHSVH